MKMLQFLEDQELSEGRHTQEGLYKIHKTTESIWNKTANTGSNVNGQLFTCLLLAGLIGIAMLKFHKMKMCLLYFFKP
jgi:hypothetical protein